MIDKAVEAQIVKWVKSVAEHTKPLSIHWCDGTAAEARRLEQEMASRGSLSPLHPERYPRSFLYRSDPSDVWRSEHGTFICTDRLADAGPTNNWMPPRDAARIVWPLFERSMAGRTMYVVPYLMGPPNSPYSRAGIEITDSEYAVLNLRVMTRTGIVALEHLGGSADFVRGIHSLGDLSPERRYICHFPATRTIWSIGSAYGGNAVLSKKSHALRLASVEARDEGWLAEHMLILGVTNPEGKTHYIAAAFSGGSGRTSLALLIPTLPGWKVETIGVEVCWMHPGADGRLWAINPEAGIFGMAQGTSTRTNPNAMRALTHDVIFTNVALRADKTPWWEGMDEEPSEALTDWRGRRWREGSLEPAAHPNSRFAVPLTNCPSVGLGMNDPAGVPISAIIFGARRCSVAPLVYQAFDWQHGVYVGATMASETTGAATGTVGVLGSDPMAMMDFCGYNMGDYFLHWLAVGKRLKHPPRVFHVNWFRRGLAGDLLWPGFGDNIRILKWIIDRVDQKVGAERTPIGYLPRENDLEIGGSDVSLTDLALLLDVDPEEWMAEVERSGKFLSYFSERLPRAIQLEHEAFTKRLRVPGMRHGITDHHVL